MKRPPSTMLQVRHRVTDVLILVEMGIALLYLFTPPLNPSRRAVVVQYIEQLGPVWIVTFGGAGLLLLAARVTQRRLVQAHTLCFGVAIFYSSALWASVILTHPFSLTVAALTSMALCSAHYAMSRWYASGGER